MIRARHPRDAAETLHGVGDALIVGRDDDCVNAMGVRRTAIDVLDHRPAGQISERFSGEPR